MESLATVPAPLAFSQRPAGGTIPLPPHFQTVGLRPGGRLGQRGGLCPYLVPWHESRGCHCRPGAWGSQSLPPGLFRTQSKGRGVRSSPGEERGPGPGLAAVGGRGGSRRARARSALISSRISSGEGGAYLPHPLGLHGARRGVEGGGARSVNYRHPRPRGTERIEEKVIMEPTLEGEAWGGGCLRLNPPLSSLSDPRQDAVASKGRGRVEGGGRQMGGHSAPLCRRRRSPGSSR